MNSLSSQLSLVFHSKRDALAAPCVRLHGFNVLFSTH